MSRRRPEEGQALLLDPSWSVLEEAHELGGDAETRPPGDEADEGTVEDGLVLTHNLERHPYNAALGDRSEASYMALKSTLVQAGDAGEVVLFEGFVISDWDTYRIAEELGLPLRTREYDGDDPAAAMCAEILHGLHDTASLRALVVVALFPWAERGRPRKSILSTDFLPGQPVPKTADEMKALANCSVALIQQAKEVHAFGLADAVMSKKIGFGAARKRIRLVRDAGLAETVVSGAQSFDEAYQISAMVGKAGMLEEVRQGTYTIEEAYRLAKELPDNAHADSEEPSASMGTRTESGAPVRNELKALAQRVRDLEREKDELVRQINETDGTELRERVSRLESRVALEAERADRAERRAVAAEEEVARLRQLLQ